MDAQMKMAPVPHMDAMIYDQLTDRRERLEAASVQVGYDADFARLLGEVDAALMRFEKGIYGFCEECHDPIEPERLIADPLMRVCLGDLTAKQRQSLEDDLELAASIQNGLLPKTDFLTHFTHVEFAYQPAGIVSGDYVDLIPHDGELYFILGDVSGKGMAASLLMSNLHAMFHSLVPLGLPVPELMARANHMFCESTMANQYATLIAGKVSETGEIEFCNAGHLPPLIIKNGEITELGSGGLPLGLFCDSNFAATCVRLERAETLLLYSDGVTEANDHTDAEFGIDRLKESIKGSSEPDDLVRRALGAIENFRGSAAKNDDLTLMALKFVG
jgi:sigma-B regulation protein RsbU (phosphoserine phosphatase)